MSNMNRQSVNALVIAAVWAAMLVTKADAAIIASEDFESYAAGSSPIGGTGGTGWTGAWGLTSPAPTSNQVLTNVFLNQGQGLEIKALSSSTNNILFRTFPSQSTDFYVGLTMRSASAAANGNDFLHYYFNNTTASSVNNGYGGGTLRVAAGGPGNYFLRKGDNTESATGDSEDSGVQHTYGADTLMVMKFSKTSGLATDPYDKIEMWVNQPTAGSPIVLASGTNGNQAFTEINTFHLRYTPLNAEGTLNLDSIVVATTYEEAVRLSLVPEPTSVVFLLLGLTVTSALRSRSLVLRN
jgi:hypothetical protein